MSCHWHEHNGIIEWMHKLLSRPLSHYYKTSPGNNFKKAITRSQHWQRSIIKCKNNDIFNHFIFILIRTGIVGIDLKSTLCNNLKILSFQKWLFSEDISFY